MPAPMTAPVAFSNSGRMREAVELQMTPRAFAMGYPHRILVVLQPRYLQWGQGL